MQVDASILENEMGTYRILDEKGVRLNHRDEPEITDEDLLQIYTDMTFARHFDERSVSLQRQGRMGTYPPISGQEGAQIASTVALNDTDWILPTYRESAVGFPRGVSPSDVLLYWMGYEEGNRALTEHNVFPFNIGVGALVPHAAGIGLGLD